MSKREVNGILLLDKPLYLSSNQALQKVKGIFQAKKAGHTGTLDPLASGMLPICFGKATKLSSTLLGQDKCYRVTIALGSATTTGDTEGIVRETAAVPALSEDIIKATLMHFVGEQSQIPPMYSALKVNGQALYKLARQGIEIERSARTVTIHHLRLLSIAEHCLTLEVICSKGTYVRVLAEDVAKALCTVGHVSALRRLYCGHFQHQTMVQMTQLLEQADDLMALDRLLLPHQKHID